MNLGEKFSFLPKLQNILKEMAENISLENEDLMRGIVVTAMTGKGAEANKEFLAGLIVKAVKGIAQIVDGKTKVKAFL